MVSSTGKLYTYRGTTQKIVCPLERLYRAQVPFITDLSVVRGLAPRFVGTHDFRNFANRLKHKYKGMSAERFSTVRTIESLEYVDEGDGRFRMEFRLTGTPLATLTSSHRVSDQISSVIPVTVPRGSSTHGAQYRRLSPAGGKGWDARGDPHGGPGRQSVPQWHDAN